MRIRLRYLLVLLLLVIAVSFCVFPASTQGETQSISELSWMSGHWHTAPNGKSQVEEHWTKPAGGSMIGMGRTLKGERTTEFEFLRIDQRADGIYYVASPNGQCPATDFKLIQLTEGEVIFANPQHDFPKRIIYKKTGPDTVTASIDGGEGTHEISFPYERMK